MKDFNKKVYYVNGEMFIDIKEGSFIFNEGDLGEEMFIIMKGSVKVFRLKEGQEIILNKLEAGDFFGEMSLLEGLNRSANVEALESTTLMVLNRNGFEESLAKNPQLVMKLLKGFSSRLRSGNERLSRLMNEIESIRRFL